MEVQDSLDIFSGYAKGILLSDSSRLWEYDVKNNQMEVMLDWDDEGVKLKHYEISLVSLLGGGRVYVMAKSPSGQDIKLVYIEEREGSEIPVKQTVVLGTYEIYDPEGNAFPVREDIFNKSIARQAADWNRRAEHDSGRDMNHVSLLRWDEYPEVTGEDEDYIKYLAENAYWDTSLNDVLSILYEETGAFWTGDKSAEEAASIIQNRVSLYLDEL